MIARIVTAAVLTAGVAAFFSPSFAQTATGSPSGSVGTTSGAAPMSGSVTTGTSGSMGSGGTMAPAATGTSGSMSGSMGATSSTPNSSMQGNMKGSGQYNVNQAQGQRRGMRGGDAAERQMTECLNNAAAQRGSFDSCKR
jgi:hypothetical protein